jgi:hypothetical protein
MRASAYVRSCEKMHAREQGMWVSLFLTAAIIVFIALQSLSPVFLYPGGEGAATAAIAGRRLSNQSAEFFAPAEIADLKPEF